MTQRIIPNPGFKVGDKVEILNNNPYPFPGGPIHGYIGKIAEIKEIHEERGYVRMVEPNYVWAFQNIRKAEEGKPNAKKPAKVKKPKKVKKKALSVLLKEAMRGNAGTVSYALRFSEMKDRIQAQDACNARMTWWYPGYNEIGPIKGECIEIIQDVGVMSAKYSVTLKKQYRQFVNWVINDSPWSAAIITKNLGNAFKHGVKFNVDVPIHHIVAAGITLREGSEYSQTIPPIFSHVLSKGYSGNVAYLISLFLRKNGKNYVQTGWGGGHHTLNGVMDWPVLREFFKKGYVPNPQHKPMRVSKSTGYQIFDNIAKNGDAKTQSRVIFGNAMGVKAELGWGEVAAVIKEEHLIKLADFLTNELKG